MPEGEKEAGRSSARRKGDQVGEQTGLGAGRLAGGGKDFVLRFYFRPNESWGRGDEIHDTGIIGGQRSRLTDQKGEWWLVLDCPLARLRSGQIWDRFWRHRQ